MRNSGETFEIATRIAHVRPFGSLPEKVEPAHTALILVDMQNDFCADGGLISNEGQDLAAVQTMAERLPGLISAAREAGVLAIFIRCVYSSAQNAYLSDVWLEQHARRRPAGYTKVPVCAEGSWGGDFYGAVRPQTGDVVISKHRYSGFHNTDLDLVLRTNGIRTIVLTGVATNVCVETTAREGFVRDYYVVVVEDGTATYSQDAHIASLRNIEQFFGEVTSLDELCALWVTSAKRQTAPGALV